MRKSIFWAAAAVVVALLIVVSIGMMTPEAIDWTPTFSKTDYIPYGCSLLYRTLDEVYPGRGIHTEKYSPYEHSFDDDSSSQAMYMIIANSFAPDVLSWNRLLSFARNGGSVFIAAGSIDESVCDSLKINAERNWNYRDTIVVRLCPSNLAADSARLHSIPMSQYFEPRSQSKATILGFRLLNQPNYLRIPLGAGFVYLHSNPYVFTNYVLSDSTQRAYAYSVLSCTPQSFIIWDEYYKTGHNDQESYYRMIFRDPRLRIAYYMILSLVTLFVLLHRKRLTRAIAIRVPKKNTTVDFVQTVGRLYYEHRDSKSIIDRMIVHFMDYLRTTFYLRDASLSRSTAEVLAAKVQQPVDDVWDMMKTLDVLSRKSVPEDADVRATYECIHDFKELLQQSRQTVSHT